MALPKQIVYLNSQNDESSNCIDKKTLYNGNNQTSHEHLQICIEKEINTESENICESSSVIRNSTTYDNLLLNPCDIQCRMRRRNVDKEDNNDEIKPAENILSFHKQDPITSMINPCSTQIGLQLLQQELNYTATSLSLAQSIISKVTAAGYNGLNVQELKVYL